MNDFNFLNYSDQMMLNIADELNIKEVRLLVTSQPKVEVVYHYDTISGTSEGFTVQLDGVIREAPKTMLLALSQFFTGNVIEDMQKVRDIVSEGLAARNKAGIKVRQPLQSIIVGV